MAPAKEQRLKLALVGCGRRGLGVYAPALARYADEHSDEVELAAACDTDCDKAEQVCREFGFGASVDDVAAMIRDYSPDVCLCVLPGFDTMMQGSQLLAQNMPVALELPLGDSFDEMMEVSEAAAEKNTTHLVVLNRRTNPYLTRADRWARQLGPIGSVTCTLATSGDIDADYFAGTVAHAVDALSHLLGRLASYTLADAGEGAIVTLPFDGDVEGRIVLRSSAPSDSEAYEISGKGFRTLATLVDDGAPSLRCWRGEHLEVDIAGAANQPPAAADGTYDLLTGFIRCLREGKPAAPTINDAMPAADLAFQIAADVLQAAGA